MAFPTSISGCRCERCGHEWVPRIAGVDPCICPKCKSPYWNRPRPIRPSAITSIMIALLVLAPAAYAQSPLVRMVQNVADDVRVIAGIASVVAVAVAGLTMAFSSGGFAGRLASVLFGVALACGATSVVAWLI
jgi:type IV secretory pathway VirB2 component (pilin)